MVRTNLRGGRPIMHGCFLMMMLRGEIVAPNHYCPLGGMTRGTRSTPYYFSKKLPSLVYVITIIQIVGKESYKEK
jgi:hypothetical protein